MVLSITNPVTHKKRIIGISYMMARTRRGRINVDVMQLPSVFIYETGAADTEVVYGQTEVLFRKHFIVSHDSFISHANWKVDVYDGDNIGIDIAMRIFMPHIPDEAFNNIKNLATEYGARRLRWQNKCVLRDVCELPGNRVLLGLENVPETFWGRIWKKLTSIL